MITQTAASKPEDAGAFTDQLIGALARCAHYLKDDPSPEGQRLRDQAIDLMTVWCLKVYQEKTQTVHEFLEKEVKNFTGEPEL
jgi:hypothetical protein